MITNELDEMLVRHLADMDDGATRLEAISTKVGDAMDELTGKWTTDHGWLKGDGDWNEDGDLRVAPPEWKPGEDWLSWFKFDYGDGDDGYPGVGRDYFWLTRLCGDGNGMTGFRFVQEQVTKVAWKKFLKAHGNPLVEEGFRAYEQSSLFLPVRISSSDLAAAVREERIEEALQPLRDALDVLKRALPKFDKLLAEAKKSQGAK